MKKHQLFIFLIIFFTFLLRIPSLFEPTFYGDECIYLSLGQAFNKGMVFYKRIFDHKPPLIYLTTALAGGKLVFFRAIAIIWNLINVYLIYLSTNLLVKKNKKTAGLLAAFLFALFSYLPEGRFANGEIFMIMPATLGLFLALKSIQKKAANLWIGVGLSYSLAFLYKPPIALDFAGLCLAFFIYNKRSFKDFFKIFKSKKLYLLLIGFFVPIIISIIYYWSQGAATPYIRSALLQNIGYISSWDGGGGGSGLVNRGVILLISLVVVYFLKNKLGFNFYLILLMSLMGGFGVFLSERPYPHYLIQVAPWTAILLTQVVFSPKFFKIITTLGFLLLMAAGVIKFNFWWYPIIPYYKNFYNYLTQQKTRQEYFNYFDSETTTEYQLAAYIQQQTQYKDNIFAWSNSSSCIYALSDRTPPCRYVTDFHITDFRGKKETIMAIKNNPPKLIVIDAKEHREFNEFTDFLEQNYRPSKRFENFQIYKLKNE
jgi:hypothetical protein